MSSSFKSSPMLIFRTRNVLSFLLSASIAVAAGGTWVRAAQSQAAAQTTQDYEYGIWYFNAQKFPEAVWFLQRAAQTFPYSAHVHYSLANALVKTNAHDRAIQEYRMAYLLEPTGPTSSFCRQALSGYKTAVPDNAEVNEFQRQLSDTIRGAQPQGAPPAPVVRGIVKTDEERAADAIGRQLQQEKIRYGISANASSNTVDVVTGEKLKAVDAETQRKVAELYSPQVEIVDEHGRVRKAYNPFYNMWNFANPDVNLKPREAQIRAAGEDQKDKILREAAAAKKGHQEWVKAKEDALDQTAVNLTNQIGTTSKSGVHLQARGTNLYVRQYVPFSSQAASNARPATVRIVRAHTQADTIAPPEEGHSKPNVRAQITY